MLEDLISVQDSSFGPKESITKQISTTLQTDPVVGEDIYENGATYAGTKFGLENSNVKYEIFKSNVLSSISETLPQYGGRMPGDVVLVILMQNVWSLDLSLAILERYGNIFIEIDEEITVKDELLLKWKNDMKNLGKIRVFEFYGSGCDPKVYTEYRVFEGTNYGGSFERAAIPIVNVDRSRVLPVVGFLTFLDAHKGLKMLPILGFVIPYFCGCI
ncbi:hypothetical protein GIB67_028109 [Kingdonia uniflora]|uniref:Uncharacterized protein n=1 Tax=Kingdonia uniflora TaxID=39325 RepID=A0A7J7NRL2_9MAGN|nr:hypothetical protein GIB67_028109 [Kingdonia uniflora]